MLEVFPNFGKCFESLHFFFASLNFRNVFFEDFAEKIYKKWFKSSMKMLLVVKLKF